MREERKPISWKPTKELIERARQEIELDGNIAEKCAFCGKHIGLFADMYCNDECEKNMEKVWNERNKRRVCLQCGEPVEKAEIKRQKTRAICKKCIVQINILARTAKELSNEIKRDIR